MPTAADMQLAAAVGASKGIFEKLGGSLNDKAFLDNQTKQIQDLFAFVYLSIFIFIPGPYRGR